MDFNGPSGSPRRLPIFALPVEPNNQPNEVDELRAELAEVEEMQRTMAELLSEVQDGHDAGDGDGGDGGDGYGPAEELDADGEPSMHRADAGEVMAASDATDATDAMDAMDADLVETCPELMVPQAGEAGKEVGLGHGEEVSEGYGFLEEAAEHSEVLESLEPLEPSDPGQDGLEDQELQEDLEDLEDQEACESETVTLPPSVEDELEEEEEHWPMAVSFAHLDQLQSVSSWSPDEA